MTHDDGYAHRSLASDASDATLPLPTVFLLTRFTTYTLSHELCYCTFRLLIAEPKVLSKVLSTALFLGLITMFMNTTTVAMPTIEST